MTEDTLSIDNEVTLRHLQPGDAQAMADLVEANRTYLAEWLDWVEHSTSTADSEKFIATCQERFIRNEEYTYGIWVDGRLAGCISLRRSGGTNEPEIGYWLDCRQAGKGITTKAAIALTKFGFDVLGFDKIVICAEPGNSASNRVAEKAGYTYRGIERNQRINKDCKVWQASRPAS